MTEIRRIQPDEWELFKAVRLAALADAPHAFGSTLKQERDLSEEAWRERVARIARFIALYAGEPVGLVGAWMQPTGEVELISMWVAPEARRSGVGRSLIDAVMRHGRMHGSGSVLLWVADGNEAAEQLYATQGFARTGRVKLVDEGDPSRGVEFQMRASIK